MRFYLLNVLISVVAVLASSIFPAHLIKAQNAASISVQYPNGKERWIKGSIQTIQWSSEGVRGSVKLILIKGDSVFGEIALNEPAKGSYNWVVGDCPASGRSAEPGNDYRIRVMAASNPLLRDDSNASFLIIPAK